MKHEIDIPASPEGWEAVAYREPKAGEYFFSMNGIKYAETDLGNLWLIVRKKQPRRIVLEETDIANAEVAFHDDDGVWKYWKIVEYNKCEE